MKSTYHGCLFNVGPLTNLYYGVHTYSDVLFPFIHALKKQGVTFTWAGIDLKNRLNTDVIPYFDDYKLSIEDDVERMTHSWDLLDVSKFDFLLCQPRPMENRIENEILHSLINKFLDAGKTVFVWEQDLFTDNWTERMKKDVVLLHPAIEPPLDFSMTHYFPFFTYQRTDHEDVERDVDFMFVGNVYFRHSAAVNFFGKLNDFPISKVVYGDWTKDPARAEFASQFTNFEFKGSTEHWTAIPLMRRAKTTLHISPEFAAKRGLMTARVFTSQIARCVCFCDKSIYGAENFFPKELIVADGNEIREKWDWVLRHRGELLEKRDEMLKPHSVEIRAAQFKDLLRIYVD